MITLTEGNLQIIFPDGTKARKFDDQDTHGLSHCMKAVDFIVELKDRFLFIECKDPEHPDAKTSDRGKFIHQFTSGAIDEDLKYKYRDSFLYEWAMGRVDTNKAIYYYVLIAMDSLNEPELLARTDALKKKLPLNGPKPGEWKKPFVHGCMVFNIKTWNKILSQFPITRIGAP